MFHATLKNLAAHKGRLALATIAIVLGVAFMAGTFVLTDTVKASFDNLFQHTAVGKDVVVQGVAPYGTGGGFGGGDQGSNRPQVPASLVETIKRVPGVRDAFGDIQGEVTLIGSNGKAITKRGPPTLAFSYDTDQTLSSFKLSSGRAPQRDDEVVIDKGTMKKQHWSIGQRVTMITNLAPQQFSVVGEVTFGTQNSLLGATVIEFTPTAAPTLFGTPGKVQQISISDVPGTSVDKVLASVAAVLPKGYEAVTGSEAAAQQAAQITKFINVFNDFLLTFALISLFVGSFLIANTFSILIGQRTRELALLRAVGASRGQVTRSMLAEALTVGLVGSALGLGLGVPLALGLKALLKAFGIGPPGSGIRLLPRTVIVSMIAGTAITLIASVGPALRASRIPPVAAMREDAAITETSLRRRAIVGGTVGILGVLMLFGGLFGGGKNPLPLVGAGAALTFLGVAVLAPFFAGRIAHLIGVPLALRGVTGRLSQENATRNPRRTAATASALMVGLAVVACIGTLGASISSSFGSIIDRSISASYVITTSGGGGGQGFSRAAEPAIRSAPGVVAMSPLTELRFHVGKVSKQAAAVDPATAPKVLNISIVRGSYDNLAKGQLLVDDKVFRNDHFKLGQIIPMGFVDTGIKDVPIGGTYKTNQFLDNYLVSYSFASANVAQLQDELILVKTATGSPAAQAQLGKSLAAYPNLTVKTASQFKADQKKMFTTLLNVVYVLLALSIIIAGFSVANTMALSVIERTREIGLVRSVGMLRRQVRAMVRGEALIVAVFGALLGIVLGVGLGIAIVEAASSSGITNLAIPVPTVAIVLVVANLIGLLAAALPARRAAKLDVLRAISTA